MGDGNTEGRTESSPSSGGVSEINASLQELRTGSSKSSPSKSSPSKSSPSKSSPSKSSPSKSSPSKSSPSKSSPMNQEQSNHVLQSDSNHQHISERASGRDAEGRETAKTQHSHSASNVPEGASDGQDATKEDPFSGLSFSVGVAENKNSHYRDRMEDVHTYVANYAEKLDWGYFAIFDGHAGKSTARWCGNNLHALVEEGILASETAAEPYDLRHVLSRAFLKADETIDKDGSGSSGSTAAVAVLRWESELAGEGEFSSNSKFDFIPGTHHKRVLYTSNVGDSRIVLCRGGRSYRLSYDHKASDPSEMERIREAGGLIVKNRVNGVFAITRSLGDSYIKNLVTGSPFTSATEISDDDEFLILACDGVWDVISDQQACKFVQEVFRQQLEQKGTRHPKAAAKRLCDYAIENATTDNVTVMVVLLDPDVFAQGIQS